MYAVNKILNYYDVQYFYFYIKICIFANKNPYLQQIKSQIMTNWNNKVKRLLKSELVRRGISNSELAMMLERIGVEETKSSIDSKISRGTFSASFFLQCLTVIGCEKIEIETYENQLSIAAEPQAEYTTKK